MRSLVALAISAAALAATASATSNGVKINPVVTKAKDSVLRQDKAAATNCDPNYECEFFAFNEDKSGLYRYDLAALCNEHSDYVYTQDGTRFHFNICGKTSAYCLPPNYKLPYIQGVAIQYLSTGQPPQKQCTTIYNETRPCTNECEVLGSDQPIFDLVDVTNPVSGGVKLQHFGEAPTTKDQFECIDRSVWPPQPLARKVIYELQCGNQGCSNQLEVLRYEESPECTYHFILKSPLACGELYTGQHSNSNSGSSSGSLSAGMFFLGVLIAAVFLVGALLFMERRRGSGAGPISAVKKFFGFSSYSSSSAAASQATGGAFGAGAGSSTYATVGSS